MDAAGFVEGPVGTLADLGSAAIDVSQGRYGAAAISLASALPIIGLAFGSAKQAKNAAKIVKDGAQEIVEKAAEQTAKHADEAAEGAADGAKFGNPQAAPTGQAVDAPTQRFEQTDKHKEGGHGSRGLLNDADAARAINLAATIKPGVRAIKLRDGTVLIFRSTSKKPGTFGFDLWHGGWKANAKELREIGDIDLPIFDP